MYWRVDRPDVGGYGYFDEAFILPLRRTRNMANGFRVANCYRRRQHTRDLVRDADSRERANNVQVNNNQKTRCSLSYIIHSPKLESIHRLLGHRSHPLMLMLTSFSDTLILIDLYLSQSDWLFSSFWLYFIIRTPTALMDQRFKPSPHSYGVYV